MYQQETNFFWYKTIHSLIVSVIKTKNTNTLCIFDAGCGTGRLMQLLTDFGSVSGIDYSSEAVFFSKKRGMKNVSKKDLNTWKGEKKYDVITSIDVLYHSGIKNDIKVLEQFYESLSNNGMLILNLAAFDVLKRQHDEVVFTERRYKKKHLVKQLKRIGFRIEKATYRMPHLFLMIIVQKIIHKMILNKKPSSDVRKTSVWVNTLFYFLGKIENKYIMKLGNIPFGSSLFIVAVKK